MAVEILNGLNGWSVSDTQVSQEMHVADRVSIEADFEDGYWDVRVTAPVSGAETCLTHVSYFDPDWTNQSGDMWEMEVKPDHISITVSDAYGHSTIYAHRSVNPA